MERRGTFDRIQCQDGVVLAVLSIEHTWGINTHGNYRWLRACMVSSLPWSWSWMMLIKADQRHQRGNLASLAGAQFLLTINCMQPNQTIIIMYIMNIIYKDLTLVSWTQSNEYM